MGVEFDPDLDHNTGIKYRYVRYGTDHVGYLKSPVCGQVPALDLFLLSVLANCTNHLLLNPYKNESNRLLKAKFFERKCPIICIKQKC